MTKKNNIVPKPFYVISGTTIDRLIQQLEKTAGVKMPSLNAKVKKTYLNPRFNG